MRIVRVFPRRTSYTPSDDMVFVGDPQLFLPDADEVHVSVTFSWDMEEGERLRQAWSNHYEVVRIGGPAFGDCGDFLSGVYVKPGVTFTTRGCNNRCKWCLVPTREGKLLEIENFAPGYIVQDNNLLQASHGHIERVFEMLRRQKRGAVFSGGLQASLVDDWFCDMLKTISVSDVFLAADTNAALKPLEKALDKLSWLGRRKLRVYVMVGGDLEADRERLEAVWRLGGLPFCQLYQPPDRFIEYDYQFKELRREWSRPAAMFANHCSR